jgi:hypothetical protein
MTRVGKYNPAFVGPASSLFLYGESPVASTKLNRWNGNIDASFWLLHRALRVLAGTGSDLYLVGNEGEDPLRVEAQAVPGMTVRVTPGLVLGPSYLIGLSAEETLPAAGTFTAPVTNPRIDAIGIAESGDWVIATGVESATPAAPSLATDVVRLANIYFRVGAVSIKNSDDGTNATILDQRPRRLSSLAHRHVGPSSPPESPNGTVTVFSTADRYVPGTLRVFVNGLAMLPSAHYTENANHQGYTFGTAPPSGTVVHHEYQPG